ITNQAGGVVSSNQVTALWLPSVTLSLSPAQATHPVGSPHNVTLAATDGAGQPVPNLTVTFQVGIGPNAGKTGQATPDASGQALFVLTSTAQGPDPLTATIGLSGGATLASNTVSATWTANAGSGPGFTLSPLTQTLPVGTAASWTATLLDA